MAIFQKLTKISIKVMVLSASFMLLLDFRAVAVSSQKTCRQADNFCSSIGFGATDTLVSLDNFTMLFSSSLNKLKIQDQHTYLVFPSYS